MERHIIGILTFIVAYNIWRYYREEDEGEEIPVEKAVLYDTVFLELCFRMQHSFFMTHYACIR